MDVIISGQTIRMTNDEGLKEEEEKKETEQFVIDVFSMCTDKKTQLPDQFSS